MMHDLTKAQCMKNLLNEVFDLVTTRNFCPGLVCGDCPLKPQQGQCVVNKIHAQAKKGLQELAAFIEAKDKCPNQGPE